jgi:hypothetical protein
MQASPLLPPPPLREEHELDDKAKSVRSVYKLECAARHGNKRIDEFVTAAFTAYQKMKRRKRDNKR